MAVCAYFKIVITGKNAILKMPDNNSNDSCLNTCWSRLLEVLSWTVFAHCQMFYDYCSDVTPPTIRCGTSVIVQASEDESTAFVSWPIPTALDNSGFLPVVTVVPALVPPTKLPIGETLITYTAEDASKNTAMCSISVLVRGKCLCQLSKIISVSKQK